MAPWILLAVALSLAAVALVAWPLLRRPAGPKGAAPAEERERAELREALERSLASIREIEHDRLVGHLSEPDFHELDAAERARAVELIRRLDELEGE